MRIVCEYHPAIRYNAIFRSKLADCDTWFPNGYCPLLFEIQAIMGDIVSTPGGSEQAKSRESQELLQRLYDELRKLAARKLAQEKPGQTLQPTALVHEAYLRLMGNAEAPRWDGHAHFFAAAAEAMRRILIENARRKRGSRRGGGLKRLDLDIALVSIEAPAFDLLALDEALTRLEQESPVRAELVKLRFFAGLTVPEAANVLGVSVATAERYWTFARTWLYAELSEANPAASSPDA